MTTTPRHPLVEEYLTDLRRRAERLPRDQREELLTELRSHVDAGAEQARSEADIRNMLDALGPPEEVVAAAEPDESGTGPTGRLALVFGVAALVLLPMAFLILFPIVLPLAVACGITAVVLGVRARRVLRSIGAPTAAATAATVTGGMAIVIPVLVFVLLEGVRTVETTDSEPIPVTDAPTTTGAE
jgi:uncharacterized membrane protein